MLDLMQEMANDVNKLEGMPGKDIDRGRAWIVLICAYIGEFFNCQLSVISGLLYIEYLQKFGEDPAKTSVVGALNIGLLSLTVPFGCVFCNRFSTRVAIVSGGALCAIGYFSSAFVSSLNWMIITNGLIVGTGFGLSTSGFTCTVGFHFKKWRNEALSVIFTVIGLGATSAVPFGLLLLQHFGLTRSLLIFGSIEANLCVLGMICRPSSIELQCQKNKLRNQAGSASKSSTLFDISLLKKKDFLFYLISLIAWNLAFAVVVIHFPNYVKNLGGSEFDIGLLMTIFTISNVSGRLFGSLLILKLISKSLLINSVSLFLGGLFTSIFLLYSKLLGGLYVFSIQLGIFTGIPNALVTTIPANLVPIDKLPDAHGFASLFSGVGVVCGPVLFSWAYKLTQSYEHCFVLAGGILLAGAVASGASTFYESRKPEEKVDINEMMVIEAEGFIDDFEQSTTSKPSEAATNSLIQS